MPSQVKPFASLPVATPCHVGAKRWIGWLVLLLFARTGIPAEHAPFLHEIRPLFANGEHLGQAYHFRNVGLIQCPNGDLLAFVEARHGVSDHTEKDVLMRRSTDRGLHWGPYEYVWGHLAEDHAGWKDPAPVVDEETGRLFYFMNTNEREKRLFYMTSDDSGHSWSDPIRIPDNLRRANWRRWRNCPGPGIQLKRGPHPGRLLIPGHIVTLQQRHHSVVWYSDDHGESWSVSEPAVQGSDEVSLVELGDGRVLMNIRSHGELDPGLNPKFRNFMFSSDGGVRWEGLVTQRDLPWESGHGSMTRLAVGARSRLLAFHPVVVKRRDLTCFLSSDEGKTWPYRKLVHPAGGYSSAIVLDNLDIALAHNHGHRGEQGIDFVRFNLSWLTEGREHVPPVARPADTRQRAEADRTEADRTEADRTEAERRRVLYREDFEQRAGDAAERGDASWTVSPVHSAPAASVVQGKFRVVAAPHEVAWRSPPIDVQAVDDVSIAVDALKFGQLTQADYLRVSYEVDGAGEKPLPATTFSSDPDEDFETYQLRKDGVDVSSQNFLQLIIRARVTGKGKALYWDRVQVVAD